MKKNVTLSFLLLCWCFSCCTIAQSNSSTALFGKPAKFTRADTLRGMLTAERSWFDVQHYALSLNINPDERSIAGYNEISFKVLKAQPVMQLDLWANLAVDSIIFAQKPCTYRRQYNAVFIDLPTEQLSPDSTYALLFYYSGKPTVAKMPPWDGGFVWKNDQYKQPFIGVACQGMGASVWFPNKDHQSDEPDRGVSISLVVPEGLTAIANGQFWGSRPVSNHRRRYDWSTEYPVNNYSISIYAADYVTLTDRYMSPLDSMSITVYALRQNENQAQQQLMPQIAPMLRCFEQYLGVYPFANDGYKLVEAPYLGMEHQTAIAYGNNYQNGYMGKDLSTSGWGDKFDYILVHETGHEWWGNNITTADIADMWVHEAFCTYTESLYVGCRFGEDAANEYINGYQNLVNNDRPIIGVYNVNNEGSTDMYYKGALMLHTIRWVINNDSLWHVILRNLNTDYRHQVVTGYDIEKYLTTYAKIDLMPVFDQYLRHIKPPTLEYSIIPSNSGNTTLRYRWLADTKKFAMPVWVNTTKGKLQIPASTEWQTQTLPLDKKQSSPFDTQRGYYFTKKQP